MAVTLTISITQNSQNIANMASNVTVKATASWTNGSFNTLQKSGWLKIDGVQYNFTSSFNTNRTSSGSAVLYTKTVNVKHDVSTGKKTLSCSASYTTGVSSGTIGASASKELTTIYAKSSLSASNGTLGKVQTLTVTRKSTAYAHTITYKCGSASGTICTKSSETDIKWTPSLNLAEQNTTGTSVSITFTITTYSGSTSIGSNTKTITCSIPTTVKPECALNVTDPTGWMNTLGKAVKGISKLTVSTVVTEAYNSPIKSCSISANGATYSSGSFTTDVLKTAGTNISDGVGTLVITATIKDARGRTGTATADVDVYDYTPPTISRLTVRRCNSDGITNDQGDHVQVILSYKVFDLDGKNTCHSVLKYKTASFGEYIPVELPLDNEFAVTDYSYIFPADTGKSYDILLEVTDRLSSSTRTTSASTGFTLMHWKADGTGIGIGKIAEESDLFDIGLMIRFAGGILPPILEPNTDLNDVIKPNSYIGANVSHYNYGNCPLTSGTFILKVESAGEAGQVRQRITQCNKINPVSWERFYYTSSWGEWLASSIPIDSGWTTLPTTSAFGLYSSSDANAVKCRKVGKMVEIRGVVTPASNIAGGTEMHTIATLPSGYRPSSQLYTLCQGSGNRSWLLRVNTSGALDFSRYRAGDASTEAAAGTWLPFQMTFLID